MGRWFFTACLSLVMLFSFVSVSKAFHTGQGGHAVITAVATNLKEQVHNNPEFRAWLTGSGGDVPALQFFQFGAHDEDSTLPWDPRNGPNGFEGGWLNHFYGPISKLGLFMARGISAPDAASRYVNKIKSHFCTPGTFKNLLPGEKAKVYDYAGRIMHLIQDMSSPPHVKGGFSQGEYLHGVFGSVFENYVRDNWDSITDSQLFKQKVTVGNYNYAYEVGNDLSTFHTLDASAQEARKYPSDIFLTKRNCLLPAGYPCETVPDEDKLKDTAENLVPEAILRTAGFIDTIYRCVKNGCGCDPNNPSPPRTENGPGGDHPDDNFDVSDWAVKNTQFGLSQYELLGLYTRTALRKGDTSPFLTRQLMEIYGEAKALPSDASQDTKEKIANRFSTILEELELLPAKDFEFSADVAVLENGFYEQSVALMNKNKEPVHLLSADFDPTIAQDHPVMLVPTAGLAGFEQSEILKTKLEEYVRLGGTLVVLAQQLGHHWNILPTPDDPVTGEPKPVSGYGYQQDQNCQQGSVFIETSHPILSSFSSATIDVGVDGYFSSYPENSTILLRRTANGQPAMILYPYGNGYVFATALYTDFAFSHSQANKSEINLVANIISWAKKPAELPQIRPGETLSLNIPVANVMDSDAASTKLKIYSAARSTLLAEQNITGHVPASGSTVIATQVSIPGNGSLGIYHVDYVLLDTQSAIVQPQTEVDSGRFVVSKPTITGSPDKPIWFSVTTTSQNVPLDAPFDYTFHVYNNSDQTRNLTIKSIFGHTRRPHEWNVTVQPRTVKAITGSDIFQDSVYLYDTMRAFLYDELNQEIGRYELSFKGFRPHAYIKLSSNKSVYSNNEDVALKIVTATGQTGTYSIKTIILGPDNALLFEDNRIMNLVSGTSAIIDMQHHLAANSNPGSYIARSEIWRESSFLGSATTSFELPRSQIVITFNEPQSFKTGDNSLSFSLRNNGRIGIGSGTFDVEFTDPYGLVIYEGSHSFSLAAGEATTLAIPIFIPSLYFGNYTLTYAQSDETKNGSPVSFNIPNSAAIGLLQDKPSYRIRETANISATIINTGKFDLENLRATLAIYPIDFSSTKIVSLLKGQDTALNFSIPFPETTSAGSHSIELRLTVPSGGDLRQTSMVSIPSSSLTVRHHGSNILNPGDNITITIENTGGIDAKYNTDRLSLTDNNGAAIHSGTANGTVRAGETKNLYGFQIPEQVVRGDVMLNIAVKDNNTRIITNFLKSFSLSGLEARIETRTDKNLYLGGETVTNITDIMNVGPLMENANLDLFVYRLKAGVEGQFSHVLPQGWLPLTQPTGVASDPEGYLYVVDPEEQRLIKIERNGRFVKEFHYNKRCWGGTRDLCIPYGVAVSQEGFIYVVDKGSSWYFSIHNCIHKFDRDGNFLDSWAHCGSGTVLGLNRPLGIAAGKDGYVYVTDTDSHRVVKLDSEGSFISAWGSKGRGPGQFIYPEGIAVDSSGNVYVTDTEDPYYNEGSHRVQKFDRDGNFITQWGGYGTDDGLFIAPSGIVVGGDGYVYVSDTSWRANKSYRIQKFDSNGVFVKAWGGEGRIEGKFNNPRGLAADEDGFVYVADSLNGRIQKFTADGGFVDLWGGGGSTNGFFVEPKGLGVDSHGHIYVADYYNERIQKFDRNGRYIKQWGDEGTGDGQFRNGPESIAVSKEGFVFAANGVNGDARIQRFDSEGIFQTSWGSTGTGDGQFTGLQRIALNAGGFVFVSDDGTKRIQKFDSNGTFIAKWGNPGSGPGQFTQLRGIAVSPDGSIYVADPYRIQKFDEDGFFLTQWGTQGTNAGQFNSISTLTTDSMGFVYTVELNPVRIQKFDSIGNFITQWEEGEGVEMDVFHSVSGIAIDNDGSILISDANRSRIRKLTPLGTEEIFRKNSPLSQSGNTHQQYNNDLGVITTYGKFYCDATLKNSLGQTVSKSMYPFYVTSGSVAILMSIEKKTYKPGEQIRISGEVVNLSDTPLSDYSLSITKLSALGTSELLRNDFDLPARGSFPFSFAFSELREGKYALTATVQNTNLKIADASEHYEVRAPMLSAEIICPDVASDQPFLVDVVMRNMGGIDANVNLSSSINEQTFALSVPQGSSRVITYPQRINEDTLYRFTISGDVNETLEKMVYQGLAASVYTYASNIYPEGKVTIPVSVENPGLLDGKVTVDIDLQPAGYSFQRDYFVPRWGIAADNLVFDLTEGDYTLTLTSQTPPASTNTSFSVKKENNIFVAPIVISTPTNGLITVSAEISNYGYNEVNGTIQLSILNSQGVVIWQSAQEISLQANSAPSPIPVNLPFSQAILESGSYTVKVAFLNSSGQELAFKTSLFAVSGANLRLAQIPSSQTVSAGEEATFAFVVTNTGGKEASAELTLKSHDFINLTRRELVSPGEEKSFPFAFPVPADLEEKDYYAEYELQGTNGTLAKGQVKYHVTGINISVAASLDKEHYREGENAHLAMIISQQSGGVVRNLFARVNYGDFESKQSFALSGSQNLSFTVPLTAMTGEKLFFGIYDEGGRSIHLNSLYIYKAGDSFTITTNKQVYNQGETVTMNIAGTGVGTMTTSGPDGYSETFLFNGSATRSFTLPQIATAGTYYIEASLVTAEGQTISMSKPIDITGISVKVKEAVLDKGKYLPGDALRLSMRIESNSDIAAVLKVWSVDPDKNSTFLGERQLSLARAEQTLSSVDYPLTITSSGIHKVLYGIYLDSLLLSSGNLSFDAGDGVILGMTTDKSDYPLGSETVAVRLNIYGKTDATITFKVNGAAVHTEPVSLNGFVTTTIPITVPGPGAHTLEGILTAGGLTSKKETKFLYGTILPDLAADVWGSGTTIGKDGALKLIATSVNRGKTTAAPISMTLHDGDALLATYSVGELAQGASQSFEYLWNVFGKAGEHMLVATLDSGNSVTEFARENNRATRRIVIPDIALITETEKESYGIGEQISINATSINLTAGTNYPNLTCTTIVRDPSGNEVFRQSSNVGLSPSQTLLTTVTWNTAALASEGKYTIRQEVVSGTTLLAEKTKIVTISARAGFALRVNPVSARIKQGETGHFAITIDAPSGWSGSVTLDAEGIPSGTIASFAPNIVNGSGTSVVSIATSAATPTGTYPIVLRGQGSDSSGIVVQTVLITLDVSGFSLQAVPESNSIVQQETADFIIKATSLNDYMGNLVLSDTTGRIGGLIVSVDNPNFAVPGGESVIRVQSSKYVPPGTYTIKISGNDGIIAKDVDLTVVVLQNLDTMPGFVLTPGPGFNNRALVTLLNRNFEEKIEFTAFSTRFGANAVMGDIDGDGEDEIIVAPGPDPFADGRVRVFRLNGVMLLEQTILSTKSGAFLAAGDIDGDWREEIVVGAGPGLKNTARVKVLSFDGQRFENTGIDFGAFPNAYKLGVKVALGDVDGDGVLEIIAGAGPSPLSPARIKVFKVDTSGGIGNWRISSTFADFVVNFGDWYPYLFGVNVAAGDIDGDGIAEIIAGAGPNPLQKAMVAIYKGDGTFMGTRFEAYPANDYRFGVNVAVRDLDGDGLAEIITGPGPSPFSDSWIRIFKGDGTLLSDGFLAFPESTKFGVKVSIGNVGE
jgi:uncharacterized membrane protein/streptogramin lyase